MNVSSIFVRVAGLFATEIGMSRAGQGRVADREISPENPAQFVAGFGWGLYVLRRHRLEIPTYVPKNTLHISFHGAQAIKRVEWALPKQLAVLSCFRAREGDTRVLIWMAGLGR